jgi:hypothetical protein
MKKKLALLLALAMIISMMPMNVFGNVIGASGAAGSRILSHPSYQVPHWQQGANQLVTMLQAEIGVDVLMHNSIVHTAATPVTVQDEAGGAINYAMFTGASNTLHFPAGTAAVISIQATLNGAVWGQRTGTALEPTTIVNLSPNGWDGQWPAAFQTTAPQYVASATTPGAFAVDTGRAVNTPPVRFFTTAGVASTATNAGAPAVGYILEPLSPNTAMLYLYTNVATNFTFDATTTQYAGHGPDQIRYFDPAIVYFPTGDTVSLTLGGIDNIPLQNRPTGGLSANVGEVRAFSNFAYFNSLNITEAIRGDLTLQRTPTDTENVALVTFRAPDNYKWVAPNHNQVVQGLNAAAQHDLYSYGNRHGTQFATLQTSAGRGITGNRTARYFLNDNGGAAANSRKFLTVALPLDVNTNIGTSFAEQIQLRGIGLVADNRAGMGDITVHYAVQYISRTNWANETNTIVTLTDDDNGIPNTIGIGTGGATWRQPTNWWDGGNAPFWRSFTAARRAYNEVGYGLRPDTEAATVRSGEFMQSLQWVRLNELAAGAWGGGLGMDVTFSVPEGVTIQRANVIMPDIASGAGALGTTNGINFDVGTDALGSWNYASVHGILATPNYVRITPPLQNWGDRTLSRYVEVRLVVSIEAGFEWKYPNGEIEVTVSGPSVANLPGSHSVVAGIAADPVSVAIDGGAIEIPIPDNRFYNVNSFEIGDIVITEAGFGRLAKGQELWIYVVGNRAHEVQFTADANADVNTAESGMVVARGRVLDRVTMNHAHNVGLSGMRYVIEEVSRERASVAGNEPGVITITGARITGPVFPGVDYKIVVSGNAIAKNDSLVAQTAGAVLPGPNGGQRWTWYDSNPYQEDAFIFDESSAAPPPAEAPAPEPTPAPAPELVAQTLILNEWSPPIDGVKPFVLIPVDANTRVGGVSPRVITTFFGGPDPTFEGGKAVIKGIHKDGHMVEVTLEAGATTGTVDGVEYDIATYSGSAAPGLVSVHVENERFYVPLRFMTNALGYTIDWNPVNATAIITK